MSQDLFDLLEHTSQAEGPGTGLDLLIRQLAEEKRHQLVFDMRLLQKRHALGLPLVFGGTIADLPLEHQGAYQAALTEAAREAGTAFLADGDVQIPNNTAFEFSGGNGTIEAIVNMREGTGTEPTIFAEAMDGGEPYYVFGASKNGGSLIYYSGTSGGSPTNDLSWTVPGATS